MSLACESQANCSSREADAVSVVVKRPSPSVVNVRARDQRGALAQVALSSITFAPLIGWPELLVRRPRTPALAP